MKNFLLSLTLCAIAVFTTQAQEFAAMAVSNNATVAMVTDNAPVTTTKTNLINRDVQFPGGMAAMTQFMTLNNKYYELAQKDLHEGTVLARFKVNADGSITNIIVLKSDNEHLNEYAINIIQSMPKWEAAIIEGDTLPNL